MTNRISRQVQLQLARDRKIRNDAGKYTIEEALELVLQNTLPNSIKKSSIKKLLKKMINEKSVKNWSADYWIFPLSIYQSQLEEIRWDELNTKWLSATKIEWRFPNPLNKINSDRTINHRKKLIKDDWIAKAQKYGEEILAEQEKNNNLTQRKLAQLVLDRFNSENIKKSNWEEYKHGTILRALSGEWYRTHKNLQVHKLS